jgi:hypothetical protein
MLDASITVDSTDGGEGRLRGKIVNRSQYRITHPVIRFGDGAFASSDVTIEPRGEATIDSAIVTMMTSDADDGFARAGAALRVPTPYWNWCDLAGLRSERIKQILADSSEVACVYATVENPPAAAKLANPGALEQHWQVVRAIVPLARTP